MPASFQWAAFSRNRGRPYSHKWYTAVGKKVLVSQQDCPNLYVLNPRAIPCPSLFHLNPCNTAESCPQLSWNHTALLCCRFQQSPSRWETWEQATPPPLLPTELCSHMTHIAIQTHLPQYPPSRQPSLSTLVNPYRHKCHPQLEEQKPL